MRTLLTATALALLAPLAGFSAEKAADMTWRKIQLNQDFTSEGISCGDFNRDGKMDIVAGPYWYEGPDFEKRHAIFKPAKYDPHGYSATTQPCYTGDFNGDGWTDVLYVVREADGWNLVWYENPAGKDVPWKKAPGPQGHLERVARLGRYRRRWAAGISDASRRGHRLRQV